MRMLPVNLIRSRLLGGERSAAQSAAIVHRPECPDFWLQMGFMHIERSALVRLNGEAALKGKPDFGGTGARVTDLCRATEARSKLENEAVNQNRTNRKGTN